MPFFPPLYAKIVQFENKDKGIIQHLKKAESYLVELNHYDYSNISLWQVQDKKDDINKLDTIKFCMGNIRIILFVEYWDKNIINGFLLFFRYLELQIQSDIFQIYFRFNQRKLLPIFNLYRIFEMGNSAYSKQELLYYYLNRKEYHKIDAILAQSPQFLEKPITKDTKHTLLMRAAFNANLQAVQYVLTKDPEINAATLKGQTALGIAIKKNSLAIVNLLIEKGANLIYKNADNICMIDLAILPGYLSIASALYSKVGKSQVKDASEYEQIGKKYRYRYVNYRKFLQALETEENEPTMDQAEYLTKEKKKFIDPVPDPRQSWKNWITRNIDAVDPPLVERSSLPENLQPQNRKLGQIDVFLTNWTRTEGKRKVSYRPEKNREVMTQVPDIQSLSAFKEDEIKSAI